MCIWSMDCGVFVVFFNDTATTEIYTLSLHDALPICCSGQFSREGAPCERPSGSVSASVSSCPPRRLSPRRCTATSDRKSTRLNSSHAYLVCRLLLEKKKHLLSLVQLQFSHPPCAHVP